MLTFYWKFVRSIKKEFARILKLKKMSYKWKSRVKLLFKVIMFCICFDTLFEMYLSLNLAPVLKEMLKEYIVGYFRGHILFVLRTLYEYRFLILCALVVLFLVWNYFFVTSEQILFAETNQTKTNIKTYENSDFAEGEYSNPQKRPWLSQETRRIVFVRCLVLYSISISLLLYVLLTFLSCFYQH